MRSGEYAHGRYQIRTLTTGNKVSARAFAGRQPVLSADGKSLDEVLGTVRSRLDDRNTQALAARTDGIPTAQEFSDAFYRLEAKIGKPHWLMLRALGSAPGLELTATELAASAGYQSYSSANERFGKLARMVAEDLEFEPDRRADGSIIWTSALAVGGDPKEHRTDDQWRWVLRPQVAECLATIKLGRDTVGTA